MLYIPTRLMTFRHARHGKESSKPIYYDGLYTASLYRNGLKSAEAVAAAEAQGVLPPLKFGSETDWAGRERVGVLPVLEWPEHESESEFLVGKCESLYQSFSEFEGNAAKATNGHAHDVANGNGHAS